MPPHSNTQYPAGEHCPSPVSRKGTSHANTVRSALGREGKIMYCQRCGGIVGEGSFHGHIVVRCPIAACGAENHYIDGRPAPVIPTSGA